MVWNSGGSNECGVRFYLNSTGTPPFAAADLAALNGEISTLHHTTLAPLFSAVFTLIEIDVLDITTPMGAGSTITYSDPGVRSGNTLSDNCATNVEFQIATRYRGGKPRMYLPPGVSTDLVSASQYESSFVSTVKTNVQDFFSSLTAYTHGGLTGLSHVLLSYYDGVDKNTPSDTPPGTWRGPGYKYPPAYRSPTAVSFPVTGYDPKQTVGSQRRRRSSTTP